MKSALWMVLFVFATGVLVAPTMDAAAAALQKGKEEGGKKQDPERALTNLIRGMQMDLESSSSHGTLSAIDSAKFDDYPRFEDMIERLAREDNIRVYFRQATNSVKDDSAQTIIDAQMELTRKDSAAPPQRRSQQLVIDFELTGRGWKIINITPRDFFQPL